MHSLNSNVRQRVVSKASSLDGDAGARKVRRRRPQRPAGAFPALAGTLCAAVFCFCLALTLRYLASLAPSHLENVRETKTHDDNPRRRMDAWRPAAPRLRDRTDAERQEGGPREEGRGTGERRARRRGEWRGGPHHDSGGERASGGRSARRGADDRNGRDERGRGDRHRRSQPRHHRHARRASPAESSGSEGGLEGGDGRRERRRHRDTKENRDDDDDEQENSRGERAGGERSARRGADDRNDRDERGRGDRQHRSPPRHHRHVRRAPPAESSGSEGGLEGGDGRRKRRRHRDTKENHHDDDDELEKYGEEERRYAASWGAIGSSDRADTTTEGEGQREASNAVHLIYGTAWKKDATERLVAEAITQGFRFIDTASQTTHYNEAGVGRGWKAAARALGLARGDLHLQSKFSRYKWGKNKDAVPYHVNQRIDGQVKESLRICLSNLQTEYLDAYLLHSPYPIIEDTMLAWRTMETFVDEGTVRALGVSNFYDVDEFKTFYKMARIKPSIVQNRFHVKSNFDVKLRKFCRKRGIIYQSFWTLTANKEALDSEPVRDMAAAEGLTPQTLMYAYMLSLGATAPLDGTKNIQHMKQDIALERRINNGDQIFSDKKTLAYFGRILGIQD